MYLACCFLLIFLPSYQSLQVSQPLFSSSFLFVCFFFCFAFKTYKYMSFNKVKSFLKSGLLKKQYSYSKLKVRLNRLKKRASCFATLLQIELKGDVVRFITYVQTCLTTNQVVASCRKMLQINLQCAKSLFYSFCSSVSKQVVCFCCPFKLQTFKIKEGCSGLVNLTET